ncbi:autotransporter outer membrane beta-barrel domain-containing protein [Alcanivorax sp. S71-1-4]|uniref:autotransporter outer membrane beta-barrel domain-containing protein n=1 Tax=Alcanivorax sp. S71-1-4 TaxID=1177159 RepID=UPI00135B37E6|nr:autotransporter domain-containing protein [Alcanivorax sp. S71-1-4]
MRLKPLSAAVRWQRVAAALWLSGLPLVSVVQASPHEHVIDAGENVTVPDDFGGDWLPGDFLNVGLYTRGDLSIINGGTVTTQHASVGSTPGAEGYLLVSGAGSTLIAGQTLVLAENGTATVTVADGAYIDSNAVSIGYAGQGVADVVVTGQDTRWDMNLTMVVGGWGNGVLTLADGATLGGGTQLVMGQYNDASGLGIGTLHASGGSQLSFSSLAQIGVRGEAELTLTSGASLSALEGIVGWNAGGKGTLNLSGTDTLWSGQRYLMIGHEGQGEATLSEGATISLVRRDLYPDDPTSLVLANAAGSQGVFNIGAAENEAAVAAGTLDLERFRFGAGDGTLVFNHTSSDYVFAPYLSGVGTLRHLAGDTTLAGGDADFDGMVHLTGGTLTLAADQVLGTGTLELDGGTLATRGDIALAHDTVQLTDSFLQVEQGSASFSGDVDLGDYLLTIGGAGNALFSGTFSSGTGALSKTGSGTLTLTGNAAAFNGTHTVSGGVFAVNTVLGGEVDVQAGGRLQGTGTVGNTTIGNGGTLAAGNSIGELTIDGDLTFVPGGVFDVEVNPAGTNSDHVYVTGTATLAGSVLHVGEVGNYSPISTYRILTADGGLIDDFDDVASDFLFLDAALIYGATTVDLELRRNDIAFASFASSHNQAAVAQAIEALGAGNVVHDEIVTQAGTPASVQQGYDQLSGELHASALTALLEDSRLLRDTATDRLRGGAGDTTLAEGNGYTGWLRPFGNWGRSDGERGTVDMDRDTQGFLLGVDTALDNGGRAGLLAGYSRTDLGLASRRGDADIDSLHLGLYGESRRGALAVRGGLFYSYQQLDTERRVVVGGLNETLTGERSANTLQGFGELGYRLGDDTTSVEGFAQLAQLHLRLNSGSEQGGAAALRGEQGNTDVTFTTLGVRPATTLGGVRVHGSLGWRHALGDVTPDTALRFAGGENFDIDAAPLARDTLVMEAGVTLSLAERASLRIGYAGQTGGGVSDHGGQATLAWDF